MKIISAGVLALLASATFVHASFSNADWVSLGSLDGANGGVNAIVKDNSTGLLYVGGTFTAVGSVAAQTVAAWNGTNWLALGSGLPGVRALAVDGLVPLCHILFK